MSDLEQLQNRIKELEDRLAASEQQISGQDLLRSVLDSLSDAVLVYDKSGVIQQANQEATNLLGISPVGMSQEELYARLDALVKMEVQQEYSRIPVLRALSGESVHKEKHKFSLPNGDEAFYSISAVPLYDSKGCLEGAVTIWHDITTLEQAVQAQRVLIDEVTQQKGKLEFESTRLQAVLDHLPTGVWFTDAQGGILYGNPAAQRVWEGAQYVGIDEFHEYKAWWYDTGELIEPEDWAVARAVRNGQISLNEVLEIQCFDGSHKIIKNSAVPIRNQSGELQGVVILNEDITERLRAENELRENQEFTKEILESINDGFFAVDRDWKLIYINSKASLSAGCRPDELIGKHLLDVWPQLDGSPAYELYQEVMETGEPGRIETTGAVNQDHWFDTSVYPTKSGISVFWLDITDRVKAERELEIYTERLLESNQALEQFAFVASHDMQEPLRKIERFGDLIVARSGGVLDEENLDYLERMRSASRRMRKLIDDLLTLSRVTTKGKPFEQVDLNEVLGRVVSTFDSQNHPEGWKINVDNLPVLQADPTQMEQLFQNLVGNAMKFHNPGIVPEVTVSSILLSPDQVQISVSDQGIGFDPRHIDRIFLPFERLVGRTEFEGTGIGLAICKKIVERHNGTITVESAKGKGSTFYITLPVAGTIS